MPTPKLHVLVSLWNWHTSSCLVFSSFELWPSGRYGLPMPKTGCPTANGFHWSTGYVHQDLEDNDSQTKASPDSHLAGSVSNDVLQYFCIKNETFTFLNRPSWPAGQYCIYRKGTSCPAGMYSGSLLLDNENANGTNKNSHNGSLPTGVYNQDTKIFFCCQTSGLYNVAIQLPVDKPFYLIAFRPYCQEVLNTVHTMEFIVYDTEDDNNHDKRIFPYPYGAELQEPRINYCYYQGMGHMILFKSVTKWPTTDWTLRFGPVQTPNFSWAELNWS